MIFLASWIQNRSFQTIHHFVFESQYRYHDHVTMWFLIPTLTLTPKRSFDTHVSEFFESAHAVMAEKLQIERD